MVFYGGSDAVASLRTNWQRIKKPLERSEMVLVRVDMFDPRTQWLNVQCAYDVLSYLNSTCKD